MVNIGVVLKDFCKEMYRKYVTRVNAEHEEKVWLDTKAASIDLLNVWLVYLNKQKSLKIYRGLNPDVSEMQRKFYVLLNPDIEARVAVKEYGFLCQNCWTDFLNMLYAQLNEYKYEMKQMEMLYAEKCQQFRDNLLFIEAQKNERLLEADQRLQMKCLQQIRMLTAENRKLDREGQELCKKHAQIENTCSKLCGIFDLIRKGRRPAGGYYNNQPDQKLFILEIK